MSFVMLFKIISGTAICYAIDLNVLFHFFVILCFFFFFLCKFLKGLLHENLPHSQPPDKKFIFNVACNLLVNKFILTDWPSNEMPQQGFQKHATSRHLVFNINSTLKSKILSVPKQSRIPKFDCKQDPERIRIQCLW